MLDSLHIKNFRCFEDLTIPELGRVNLIVGKNNSGKSTLLEAILFFAESDHEKALKTLAEIRGERFYQLNWSEEQELSTQYKIWIGNNSDPIKIEYKIVPEIIINRRVLSQKDYEIPSSGRKSYPYSFIPTTVYSESELAEAWDEIRIQKQDSLIKDVLRIVEANIDDVFYTAKRVTMVSLASEKEARSIKSMGEGMSRLLQIFLYAFQARGGFLLIDEFENGLHYSIQEEIWEKLFKLAKELDIQIFATTHSEDTVKTFCKVALASAEEGRLIVLGRSPAPEDNGRIVAVSYDEKEIAVISRTSMEVR